MTAFEELGVLPEITKAIEEMEWTLPTDVQAEAIPLILGGGDVLMAAETGSGKTAAFSIPLIQIVWETLKDIKEGKSSSSLASAQSSSHCVLSLSDRDRGLAISSDGLQCQSRDEKMWQGCRGTKGVYSKGKYYYEATVADEGLCRVGFSTKHGNLDLGKDRFGFGYGGTGKKALCGDFTDYGESFGKCDVITCCVDYDSHKIYYYKNGTFLGDCFLIPDNYWNEPLFPAVVMKNAELHVNFNEGKYVHKLPAGYVPFANAPQENVASNENRPFVEVKFNPTAPKAIILEPSRELAEQTYEHILKLKKYLESPSIRALVVMGGASVKDQITMLKNGVDIVVGTLGRLEDLVGTGQLSLTECRFFVIDEADGLLRGGFAQLIHRMHAQIPKMSPDGRRLQMIVCSATLHDFDVKKLAEKIMHFPTWVDLKGEDTVPETVHHVVVPIDARTESWHSLHDIRTDGVHYRDNLSFSSPETLSEGTKKLKFKYCLEAIKKMNMDQAIIFCRTKVDCDNLEIYLTTKGNNFSCVCLHGDRSPDERKENLESFKRKRVKYLICTDVAARGLDISGLPFMINVTLPDEKSNYVHRIGRVGRAERMGLAISLVSTVPEKVWYHGTWCKSRGKNCNNTNLTDSKGCCIWQNEQKYLADIEDHLGITIQQIDTKLDIPVNEFDGKVVYGQKRKENESSGAYHLKETASSLVELTNLETMAQLTYLKRHFAKDIK